MMTFQQKYKKDVAPLLQKEFGYANIMAVPRIEKVVINVGVGRYGEEERERIVRDLSLICGQKPAPRGAQKSIASFKIRQGQVVGYTATLRGEKMYSFLERLIASAFPRTRDFRGISPSSIDPYGNITIGIKEHIVFPEMIGEDAKTIFGFEATIVTSAKNHNEAFALLRGIGIPFKGIGS